MNGDAKRSAAIRWALFAGALVAAVLFPALCARPAAATDVQPAGWAGAEECADCHEEIVEGLKGTMHGKAGFAELSSHGCETCHGATADHVAKPKDASARPRNLADLTPAEQVAVCRDCHSGGLQTHWTGSVHDTRDVSCLDCHSVHSFKSAGAQLKEATVAENCFQCHQSVRAEMRKTSHHPVREGKMGCEDCHNPHGTTTPKMIAAASVNDQCYECHTEKRGPFLWEHAPVRESCLNCHTPHGSNHAKLQLVAVPYQCQLCHLNTRHPGSLYDATTLPGAQRQSNRTFERSCVNCHAAIHGSNHPSGPYLGR